MPTGCRVEDFMVVSAGAKRSNIGIRLLGEVAIVTLKGDGWSS